MPKQFTIVSGPGLCWSPVGESCCWLWQQIGDVLFEHICHPTEVRSAAINVLQGTSQMLLMAGWMEQGPIV